MYIRRVVTGHALDGTAIIASDQQVPGVQLAIAPGAEFHSLWRVEEAPRYPDDGSEPPYRSWFPPVGGFHFAQVITPPDAWAAGNGSSHASPPDTESAIAAGLAEAEAKLPGLMAPMEPENFPFHRSDTLDVLYIVSGGIVLDLGDGKTAALNAGDCVVQNGTRHAWNNPGSVPCVMIAVSVGAHREG